MPPVHDDALRKLADAKAMMDELLDPIEDAERIGAEMRDAMLSFDRDAYRLAEEEAERAVRAQRRLRALWLQASEAVDTGNEERGRGRCVAPPATPSTTGSGYRRSRVRVAEE